MEKIEKTGTIMGFIAGLLIGIIVLNYIICPIFLGLTAIEVLRLPK